MARFKNEYTHTQNIDSLTGENIRIIGKVEGTGNLRIDGYIEGDIDYKGDVVISETGRVKGNINCSNITISGVVEGNINATGKLAILETGKLTGDVEVFNIVISDNGYFQGTCKMRANKPVEMEESKENKENKESKEGKEVKSKN